MEKTTNNRALVISAFIVLVIGLRTIAPLNSDFQFFANFSGLGAMAIFSGSYFKNKTAAFLLPMLVLLVSDITLGLVVDSGYLFYSGWYYTYIALLAMIFAGKVFAKNVSATSVLAASLVGVFLHWIIADFGVWLGSTVYPQTLTGFWACLVAAIPFERNFLLGTIIYAAVLFGAFELLKIKYPSLQLKKA